MAADQFADIAEKIDGKTAGVAAVLLTVLGKVVHSVKRGARVEAAVRELKRTSEAQALAIESVREEGIALKRDVVALRELIERVDEGARRNAEHIREQVSGVGERVDHVLEIMINKGNGGRG